MENKQNTMEERFDGLWNKHCKPNGYCVRKPSLFEKDIEVLIQSEKALAVAEERKRIAKDLEEVYMGRDDEDTYISLASRVALYIKSLRSKDNLQDKENYYETK